jgi:hypothetical protein
MRKSLALLAFGALVAACTAESTPTSAPTPDIQATVDARVAEELQVQTKIDAAVAKALEAAVTPTPTPVPTPTGTHQAPDPTPTEKTLATPTPSITAKERLISIGFNVPRAVSVADAGQEYVASLDIPIEYRDRFIEVQEHLKALLGGYPNYVYVAFNPDGTEKAAQPVFDKLIEVKYHGYEDGYTVAELAEKKAVYQVLILAGRRTGAHRPPIR